MNHAIAINAWWISKLESASQPTRCASTLREKGWTLRPAAKVLGVNFTHLHRVLRGDRHSASLLRRVAKLPTNPTKP